MVSSKKKWTVMNPIRRQMKKTQPIQWTERPTGALVAVNSLWPYLSCSQFVEIPRAA